MAMSLSKGSLIEPKLPDANDGWKYDKGGKEESVVKCVVIPDGRVDPLCNIKDSDPDPLDPSKTTVWGKPVIKGKNQGAYCFYCVKTWRSRLSITHKTMEAL